MPENFRRLPYPQWYGPALVPAAGMGQAGVMPGLPTPLRAALGLAATALDEARHLPDRAIELPMLAVSTALQMSLRAQQRYAALAARGDALLTGRITTDEPPPWATFDPSPDPVTAPGDPAGARGAGGADELDVISAESGVPDVPAGNAAAPGPLDDVAAEARDDVPPLRPRTTRAKTVRRPRNGAPSAFDTVGEDEG